MKQVVVLSGKGGAGKTSLVAAFAVLSSMGSGKNSTVLADTDVDASNLELVLSPVEVESREFRGGQIAVVNQANCQGCGLCETVCRFDAVRLVSGFPVVDPLACEGCAACRYQCPEEAIAMQEQVAGRWFLSDTPYGPLVHAHLEPARENSGKLVSLVKQRARDLAESEGYEMILIDGPPGIGCPVISSVSGADLALVIAEPSLSGLQDMRRAVEMARHFQIPTAVCVNKYDLYPEGWEKIRRYCQQHDVELLGNIPFDETITAAMTRGQPVINYQPQAPASKAIEKIWLAVRDKLSRLEA
ncbi:MAG: ATP-binding protein [Anaerolineales bacterium]|nr:ATP-binding protein [Anaerolineales bacterium]